jgi:hypothetical protein
MQVAWIVRTDKKAAPAKQELTPEPSLDVVSSLSPCVLFCAALICAFIYFAAYADRRFHGSLLFGMF